MGEEREGWLLGVAGPVPPFQVPQHPPGPVNSHPCPVGAGLSPASPPVLETQLSVTVLLARVSVVRGEAEVAPSPGAAWRAGLLGCLG